MITTYTIFPDQSRYVTTNELPDPIGELILMVSPNGNEQWKGVSFVKKGTCIRENRHEAEAYIRSLAK